MDTEAGRSTCNECNMLKLHSEYRSTYKWHEYQGKQTHAIVRKVPFPKGGIGFPGGGDNTTKSQNLPPAKTSNIVIANGTADLIQEPPVTTTAPRSSHLNPLTGSEHHGIERSKDRQQPSTPRKSKSMGRIHGSGGGEPKEKWEPASGPVKEEAPKPATTFRGHRRVPSDGVAWCQSKALENEQGGMESDDKFLKRTYKSEYRKKFRPFSQYQYSDGKFSKAKAEEQDNSKAWYKEVLELRKQAGQYRCRGWGVETASDRMTEIYTKQVELWEQVSRRSSLQALSLASSAAPSRPISKAEKEIENSRRSSPLKNVTIRDRPYTAPMKPKSSNRASTDRTDSKNKETTPRHHYDRTTGASGEGLLITSPTRDRLDPVTPNVPLSRRSPRKTTPVISPTKDAYRAQSSGRIPSVKRNLAPLDKKTSIGRSVSVGPESRSPKRISRPPTLGPTPVAKTERRPRPTSLSTNIRRKGTDSHQSQSEKKISKKPFDVSGSPKRSDLKSREEKRRSNEEEAKKDKVAKDSIKEVAEKSKDLIKGKSTPEPRFGPDKYEPVVKTPPEPTRVKSPDQVLVKSPDPVNWTVPLDTGKTFTVTHNIPDGETARGTPSSEHRPPIDPRSRQTPEPTKLYQGSLAGTPITTSGTVSATQSVPAYAPSSVPDAKQASQKTETLDTSANSQTQKKEDTLGEKPDPMMQSVYSDLDSKKLENNEKVVQSDKTDNSLIEKTAPITSQQAVQSETKDKITDSLAYGSSSGDLSVVGSSVSSTDTFVFPQKDLNTDLESESINNFVDIKKNTTENDVEFPSETLVAFNSDINPDFTKSLLLSSEPLDVDNVKTLHTYKIDKLQSEVIVSDTNIQDLTSDKNPNLVVSDPVTTSIDDNVFYTADHDITEAEDMQSLDITSQNSKLQVLNFYPGIQKTDALTNSSTESIASALDSDNDENAIPKRNQSVDTHSTESVLEADSSTDPIDIPNQCNQDTAHVIESELDLSNIESVDENSKSVLEINEKTKPNSSNESSDAEQTEEQNIIYLSGNSNKGEKEHAHPNEEDDNSIDAKLIPERQYLLNASEDIEDKTLDAEHVQEKIMFSADVLERSHSISSESSTKSMEVLRDEDSALKTTLESESNIITSSKTLVDSANLISPIVGSESESIQNNSSEELSINQNDEDGSDRKEQSLKVNEVSLSPKIDDTFGHNSLQRELSQEEIHEVHSEVFDHQDDFGESKDFPEESTSKRVSFVLPGQEIDDISGNEDSLITGINTNELDSFEPDKLEENASIEIYSDKSIIFLDQSPEMHSESDYKINDSPEFKNFDSDQVASNDVINLTENETNLHPVDDEIKSRDLYNSFGFMDGQDNDNVVTTSKEDLVDNIDALDTKTDSDVVQTVINQTDVAISETTNYTSDEEDIDSVSDGSFLDHRDSLDKHLNSLLGNTESLDIQDSGNSRSSSKMSQIETKETLEGVEDFINSDKETETRTNSVSSNDSSHLLEITDKVEIPPITHTPTDFRATSPSSSHFSEQIDHAIETKLSSSENSSDDEVSINPKTTDAPVDDNEDSDSDLSDNDSHKKYEQSQESDTETALTLKNQLASKNYSDNMSFEQFEYAEKNTEFPDIIDDDSERKNFSSQSSSEDEAEFKNHEAKISNITSANLAAKNLLTENNVSYQRYDTDSVHSDEDTKSDTATQVTPQEKFSGNEIILTEAPYVTATEKFEEPNSAEDSINQFEDHYDELQTTLAGNTEIDKSIFSEINQDMTKENNNEELWSTSHTETNNDQYFLSEPATQNNVNQNTSFHDNNPAGKRNSTSSSDSDHERDPLKEFGIQSSLPNDELNNGNNLLKSNTIGNEQTQLESISTQEENEEAIYDMINALIPNEQDLSIFTEEDLQNHINNSETYDSDRADISKYGSPTEVVLTDTKVFSVENDNSQDVNNISTSYSAFSEQISNVDSVSELDDAFQPKLNDSKVTENNQQNGMSQLNFPNPFNLNSENQKNNHSDALESSCTETLSPDENVSESIEVDVAEKEDPYKQEHTIVGTENQNLHSNFYDALPKHNESFGQPKDVEDLAKSFNGEENAVSSDIETDSDDSSNHQILSYSKKAAIDTVEFSKGITEQLSTDSARSTPSDFFGEHTAFPHTFDKQSDEFKTNGEYNIEKTSNDYIEPTFTSNLIMPDVNSSYKQYELLDHPIDTDQCYMQAQNIKQVAGNESLTDKNTEPKVVPSADLFANQIYNEENSTSLDSNASNPSLNESLDEKPMSLHSDSTVYEDLRYYNIDTENVLENDSPHIEKTFA